jgi:hypothetical protein
MNAEKTVFDWRVQKQIPESFWNALHEQAEIINKANARILDIYHALGNPCPECGESKIDGLILAVSRSGHIGCCKECAEAKS